MTSDLVAGIVAFSLAAIKITFTPVRSYLFVVVWALIFYVAMCPITETLTGKEYLRNWTRSRSWELKKHSKKKDPFYYYLSLILAAILSVFSLVMLFTVK